jgi:hypothetical protein
MATQAATADSMMIRRSSDPDLGPTRSPRLGLGFSEEGSSPSTEEYVRMATLAATKDSMIINRIPTLHPDSSTPSDVSLSDDDEEVQRAARHLQEFTRLLSSQTPPSSSSGDDGDDDDYQMDIPDPIEDAPEPPSSPVQRALPSKLGK